MFETSNLIYEASNNLQSTYVTEDSFLPSKLLLYKQLKQKGELILKKRSN